MIRTARFVLGAVVVGLAVTFGCLAPVHYSDEGLGGNVGQGGTTATMATASTGSVGGGQPCSATSPCEDDNNACTTDACTSEFCTYTPLTIAKGPASTECITIGCVNGASTTPIFNDKAKCGIDLECNAIGQCTGCKDSSACPVPPDCHVVTCVNTVCEVGNAKKNTTPKSVPDTKKDCLKPICDGNGAIVFAFDDADLPADDGNPCTGEACSMGGPVYPPSASTTACVLVTNPKAKVCDGGGTCVECAADGDCVVGEMPSCDILTHTCVSCSDMKQNGSETGLDCGGSTCPKCDGDLCGQPAECKSLACSDTLCCNKACAGECVACDLPGKKGACTPVSKGLEDSGCKGNGKACTGAGACVGSVTGKAGEACSQDTDCYAEACNGMCRLPNFAPCNENAECASLRCVANACTECSMDSDCASKKCAVATGRCLIPDGGICANNSDCSGGVCDSARKLCGLSIGGTCANGSDCATQHCNANNLCAACTVATQAIDCASHDCNPIGVCRLITGAPCVTNMQCSSGVCNSSFPAKCQ